MSCSVPFCNSKAIKGVSNFGIPKNDILLNLWEQSLRMKLKQSYRICINHFKHEDVIKTWESGQGLSKYTICLRRARLRQGAIPRAVSPDTVVITDSPKLKKVSLPPNKKVLENIHLQNIREDHCYSRVNTLQIKADLFDINNIPTENVAISTFKHSTPLPKPVTTDLFKIAFKTLNLLNIPPKWFSDCNFLHNNDKVVAFHKLGPFSEDFARCIEKQIVLTRDSSIFLLVYGKKIGTKDIGLPHDYKPETPADLEKIIRLLESLKVCQGAVSSNNFNDIKSTFGLQLVESFGRWRHLKCSRILSQNSNSNVCLWCKRLWTGLKKRVYKSKTRLCYSPNKNRSPEKLKTRNVVIKKQQLKTY